jgi:hypothetical protein
VDELLAWIYPNRIAIGITAGIALAVLAIVGWRRGWHHVARRHPRTSALGLITALAVGLPVGWYLGSPLIIRSELVEPPPVADAGARISPGAGSAAPSASLLPIAESARPTAESTPAPSLTALRGRFVGADDFHFARGTARLVETSPGRYTLRMEDFSVRNGPDLFVYLSPNRDGYAKGALELGRLKATDGSFNYSIPSSADVGRIRSVVIWCKAFSVQFGAAELQS